MPGHSERTIGCKNIHPIFTGAFTCDHVKAVLVFVYNHTKMLQKDLPVTGLYPAWAPLQYSPSLSSSSLTDLEKRTLLSAFLVASESPFYLIGEKYE